MASRRKERERALQVLFTMDLTENWDADPENAFVYPEGKTESRLFSIELVIGVSREKKEIDEEIQSAAKHWQLSRMNLIDRNLLRIAAFELLFCKDIPVKVSINEALELAKIYGTAEARRFLNGILDKIAKGKKNQQG